MTFWTPDNFARVTAGRWLIEPTDADAAIAGVTIDSRDIQPGQAFIAIRGERFDGHDYMQQAIDAGASLVIVEHGVCDVICGDCCPGVLAVKDTVAALQSLAAAWRDELIDAGVKVVAVTGSNGKTTTRCLIHTVLSAKLPGSQSPRSFNNHLGVPLTLLAARRDDRFLVAEVGTNHPGEIEPLAKLLRPDIAVVTNIGEAHIGHFGSREAIADEKLSLLRHLRPGGVAFVPGELTDADMGGQFIDDSRLKLPQGVALRRFGDTPDADLRVTARRIAPDGRTQRFAVDNRLEIILPLPGSHNVINAAIAVAVARTFEIEDAAIAEALAHAQGAPMRLSVQRVGAPRRPITIINDAYNANPQSVAAAIDTLMRWPLAPAPAATAPTHARRVIVFADMLELGDSAKQMHREIGRRIGEAKDADGRGVALVILVGELAMWTAEALAQRFPDIDVHASAAWTDDLPAELAGLFRPDDVVLLKGSRGMQLERLIPAIEARVTQTAEAA